jgi:hypothetical protein
MTIKSKKVITVWERLKRETVWHPINTDPTDDDRSGPRFWFPTYDMIAFALGISALFVGSPLLNSLFPAWATTVLGTVLMIAAVLCFVGVVIPRFSIVELIGKLAIVFMLGGYAGTVAFRSKNDDNQFVVLVLVMAVWLLGPRVTKLFLQVNRQWNARKAGGRLADDHI